MWIQHTLKMKREGAGLGVVRSGVLLHPYEDPCGTGTGTDRDGRNSLVAADRGGMEAQGKGSGCIF